MRSHPRTRRESKTEEVLLGKIHQDLPEESQRLYKKLIRKRRAETLTPAEHREITRLSHQVEELGVQRLESLIELAQLRGTTLDALMEELGVKPRSYGLGHA